MSIATLSEKNPRARIPALEKLASLLPARFKAAEGYFKEAAGARLFVRAKSDDSARQVELDIRMEPGRSDGGFPGPRPSTDGEEFAPLRRKLLEPEPQIRAAACQALGQVGDETVLQELFVLASDDPDTFVQQTARQAIEKIEMPAAELALFSSVGLTLTWRHPSGGGDTTLGPLRTDRQGSVRFQMIPADADCDLNLENHPSPIGNSTSLGELGNLLSGLTFSDAEPAWKEDGPHSVTIQPLDTDDPERFSALLRLRPTLSLTDGASLPGVAARRGTEFWSPSFVHSGAGLVWFHRLPRGQFVTHLSTEWPSQSWKRTFLYGLSESIRPGGSRADDALAIQVVHPPDRRLVAMIESDRRGCAVLTVETEAPELRHARIRYLLGSEQGEFSFSGPQARASYRTSLCLEQPYRGDEASRLALQVDPYSEQ